VVLLEAVSALPGRQSLLANNSQQFFGMGRL
jgi:hypothetical protein